MLNNVQLEEGPRSDLEKFIKLCSTKSKTHLRNSLNSRKWKNAMEICSAFIAATTSLTMPILAITGSDSITVAVVGNVFVFCNVIIGALKQNYGFITLDYQHNHLSSEFGDLKNEFRNFQRRGHSEEELEKLIIKFQGINSRSNIQSVKDCHFYFCCYN